jgi:hypothetical protein
VLPIEASMRNKAHGPLVFFSGAMAYCLVVVAYGAFAYLTGLGVAAAKCRWLWGPRAHAPRRRRCRPLYVRCDHAVPLGGRGFDRRARRANHLPHSNISTGVVPRNGDCGARVASRGRHNFARSRWPCPLKCLQLAAAVAAYTSAACFAVRVVGVSSHIFLRVRTSCDDFFVCRARWRVKSSQGFLRARTSICAFALTRARVGDASR